MSKKKKLTLVNILVSCGTCTIKEDDNADKYAFKSRSFIKSVFTLFAKTLGLVEMDIIGNKICANNLKIQLASFS